MLDKLIGIYAAFFLGADIPRGVHSYRIDKCLSCNYLSTRASSLNWRDRLRKILFSPPFCTLCKCQIYEKTSQGREECALRKYKNEFPLWGRIYVKFNSKKKMNLTNLSGKQVQLNYDTDNAEYTVSLERISSEDKSYSFLLQLDFEAKDFKALKHLKNSCGSCIATKLVGIDGRKITTQTFVKNQGVLGTHTKYIYVGYLNEQEVLIEERIKVVYVIF